MSPARPVLSVLDLVPVSAGRTRADALAEMVALARTADDAGYARYWLSEHHGSTTYLASATTILMGQVLAATERIGVASGGIMLPNHAPLVIAEQIGTLATLHPGRVGLGLGRAPGTDPLTASALRRRDADPAHFANEVLETLAYLGAIPDDALSAVPGSLLPPAPVPPLPVRRVQGSGLSEWTMRPSSIERRTFRGAQSSTSKWRSPFSRSLGTITPSQAGLRLLQRTPFASTRVAEQSAARTARLAIAGVRQE